LHCERSGPAKTEARKVTASDELSEHTLKSTCWLVNSNSYGTGWVLKKEKRLIVTNDHVVEGSDMLMVYFPVKKDDAPITVPEWYKKNVQAIRAAVIDGDKRCDLALLQPASIPSNAIAGSPRAGTQWPGRRAGSTQGFGGRCQAKKNAMAHGWRGWNGFSRIRQKIKLSFSDPS
jgi:S1-C subfamily serine protease